MRVLDDFKGPRAPGAGVQGDEEGIVGLCRSSVSYLFQSLFLISLVDVIFFVFFH